MMSNYSEFSHVDTDDLFSELLHRYGSRQIVFIAVQSGGMVTFRDMHEGDDSIPPVTVLEKVIGMLKEEAKGE